MTGRIFSNRSRRQFLTATAGVGGAMLLGLDWLRADAEPAASDPVDPQIRRLLSGMIAVDMHNHVDVPITADKLPGPDIDLAGEMKRSGLSAICMTFAVDYQPFTEPGQAFSRFTNAIKAMDTALEKNHMQRSLTMKDLQTAHDQSQPTVIQAVEGAHFLEGKIERVELAYKQGLRVLGLLHDHDADPPLGDLYTAPAHLGGLTDLGAKVIRECDRLGIVVDLTHASADTVAAAIKVSTKPMLFSHTGLDTQLGKNRFIAQMMRTRLLRKEHAKVISDAGGIVGVWTHLADTVEEYVINVRAMVDVCGVDHVGIGTDTKLTAPYQTGPGGPSGGSRDGGARQGPPGDGLTSRPNGGPGGNRGGGGRTNQAWSDMKSGFGYAVAGEMVRQGFTAEEIKKIMSVNFCRVFEAVTSGHG